jgi:hypothetical protein
VGHSAPTYDTGAGVSRNDSASDRYFASRLSNADRALRTASPCSTIQAARLRTVPAGLPRAGTGGHGRPLNAHFQYSRALLVQHATNFAVAVFRCHLLIEERQVIGWASGRSLVAGVVGCARIVSHPPRPSCSNGRRSRHERPRLSSVIRCRGRAVRSRGCACLQVYAARCGVASALIAVSRRDARRSFTMSSHKPSSTRPWPMWPPFVLLHDPEGPGGTLRREVEEVEPRASPTSPPATSA